MPSLTMPNVGEGVTEGEIVRWLKQLGDFVARDEPVVEIETDKAIVEIPSPFEGTLTSILVPEGETVPIGTAIAEITTADSATPEARRPHQRPHRQRPSPRARARTGRRAGAGLEATGRAAGGRLLARGAQARGRARRRPLAGVRQRRERARHPPGRAPLP